jgi:hypothetical protein
MFRIQMSNSVAVQVNPIPLIHKAPYLADHLPKGQLIGETRKIADMIRISEQEGVDPRGGYPDLHGMGFSLVS